MALIGLLASRVLGGCVYLKLSARTGQSLFHPFFSRAIVGTELLQMPVGRNLSQARLQKYIVKVVKFAVIFIYVLLGTHFICPFDCASQYIFLSAFGSGIGQVVEEIGCSRSRPSGT